MAKCDRCGCESLFSRDLLSVYQTSMVKTLCPACASIADSFVNYCGVKKECDLLSLNIFLRSGNASVRAYSAMINGGYY